MKLAFHSNAPVLDSQFPLAACHVLLEPSLVRVNINNICYKMEEIKNEKYKITSNKFVNNNENNSVPMRQSPSVLRRLVFGLH